jgi:hypothetical protein
MQLENKQYDDKQWDDMPVALQKCFRITVCCVKYSGRFCRINLELDAII